MRIKKKVIIIYFIFNFLFLNLFFHAQSNITKNKIKILHITSYHVSWPWSDDQFEGFKNALKDLNIEYKTFEMDTKRQSSLKWKNEIGKKARDLIDSFKPDLIYTTDDNAQEYAGKYYVNKSVPVVFSGINSDPKVYGYVGSQNVTGSIEREYILETVKLLKAMVPNIKKIIVIVDIDITWIEIAKRIKFLVPQYFPEIEVVTPSAITTFEEYKQKIRSYQTPGTALALLGIYAFLDEKGRDVPFDIVLKWTAENSNIPDFTFWDDRVYYGTLCAVYLSGFHQGLAAGQLARKILVDKISPSELPIQPNIKGLPIINLARARSLKIKLDNSLLLSVEVADKYAWDKK